MVRGARQHVLPPHRPGAAPGCCSRAGLGANRGTWALGDRSPLPRLSSSRCYPLGSDVLQLPQEARSWGWCGPVGSGTSRALGMARGQSGDAADEVLQSRGSPSHPRGSLSRHLTVFGILLLFSFATLAPKSQPHQPVPHVCCSQPQEVCGAPGPPTHALLVATFWVMAPLAPGPQQGTSLPPSTLSQSHAGSPCRGGPCFLTPCTSGFPSLLCSWAPNAAMHSPAVTHGTWAQQRVHGPMQWKCVGIVWDVQQHPWAGQGAESYRGAGEM